MFLLSHSNDTDLVSICFKPLLLPPFFLRKHSFWILHTLDERWMWSAANKLGTLREVQKKAQIAALSTSERAHRWGIRCLVTATRGNSNSFFPVSEKSLGHSLARQLKPESGSGSGKPILKKVSVSVSRDKFPVSTKALQWVVYQVWQNCFNIQFF